MIQNVFWAPPYAVEGQFDTISKSRALAADLTARPIHGTRVRPPYSWIPLHLNKIHDPSYVHLFMRGLDGEHFARTREGRRSVLYSTAGMVSAAQDLLAGHRRAGSLSSGMHHADRSGSAGFCTINGIAAAVWHLLDAGLDKVLVIDFDAHCGGGTWDIIARWPGTFQLDVSTDPFDCYDAEGRARLVLVDHRIRYLQTIERELIAWSRRNGRPQAIVYNAGVDPFEGDEVGGLEGIRAATLRQRDRMVFEWAGHTPLLWGLAGGYWHDSLTALHRATIEESCR